jgi:hypothetical protein
VAALLVAVILAYLVRPSLPPPKITGSTQITQLRRFRRWEGKPSPCPCPFPTSP